MNDLIYAVQANDLKEVNRLINLGFNVNTIDKKGRSALHFATIFSNQSTNMKIFQTLIDAKIDLNLQDLSGETALYYACKYEAIEAIQKLIKAGADVNLTNYFGFRALDLVKRNWMYEYTNIEQLLIKHGAKEE